MHSYLSFFLRTIGAEPGISRFSWNYLLTGFDFLCLQLTNFAMSTLLSIKRSFRTWPALSGVLPVVWPKYKFNKTSKLWEADLYMTCMKLDFKTILFQDGHMKLLNKGPYNYLCLFVIVPVTSDNGWCKFYLRYCSSIDEALGFLTTIILLIL